MGLGASGLSADLETLLRSRSCRQRIMPGVRWCALMSRRIRLSSWIAACAALRFVRYAERAPLAITELPRRSIHISRAGSPTACLAGSLRLASHPVKKRSEASRGGEVVTDNTGPEAGTLERHYRVTLDFRLLVRAITPEVCGEASSLTTGARRRAGLTSARTSRGSGASTNYCSVTGPRWRRTCSVS